MEKLREEFVREVLDGAQSKSALCRKYGISRPTGDKWLERYRSGSGYADQSRRPFHTPNRTEEAVEAQILALRQARPALGAVKLKRMLENRGLEMPASSTVNAILKRNGCISKEASLAATPYKRFEREQPNDLWQCDFKGHFALADGTRCHPLTVIDDNSRFCLAIDAKENERFPGVKDSFMNIFEQYGLPNTLLCDNGNPWGTSQSVGYTSFEVWLMELGVLTIHGRPLHPQTQGKDERFNGTLTRELLNLVTLLNMLHAQGCLDDYRCFYNNERPHHALGLEVPAARYTPSERRLPRTIEEWDYGDGVEIRKIKSSGFLTFNGQGYFLSEAFRGKQLGVRLAAQLRTDAPHNGNQFFLLDSFYYLLAHMILPLVCSSDICIVNR